MIIHPSKIIEHSDYVRIQAAYESGIDNGILWYNFPLEYRDNLVLENADAFVVGLFLFAMKKGEDIYLKSKISSKLFYNLTTYLIPALVLSNEEFKSIKIIPHELNDENLNIRKATATGSSCGIDSMATIMSHLELNNSYSLNYLTYLDAGSHGKWNGEIAKKIYNIRLKKVKEFSSLLELPLIEIKTNIGEILGDDFQKAHSLRNLSCLLNLQKIISVYYYASAYRFDYFKLDKNDTSSWDILITRFISTESLEFVSSMSQLNRIERTNLVSKFEPAFNFLDVCTLPIFEDKINCSQCDKCMRTLLTLDSIGKLNEFSSVFNIDKYYNLKNVFIGKVVATRNSNQINLELYNYLKQTKKIKFTHYLYYLEYNIRVVKNKINKKLKILFKGQ